MARYPCYGVWTDAWGRVIESATVTVYEKGTTTLANIYTADTGGSAVNSVTTGDDGSFLFYVDTDDYAPTKRFKIVLSKTLYSDYTEPDVRIFPAAASEVLLDSVSGKSVDDLFDGGHDVAVKPKAAGATGSLIPLADVTDKHLHDLFDGGYDVPIKPSFIFGGANNTNGHTVPDTADDTFALLTATQTFTGKTFGSQVLAKMANAQFIGQQADGTPVLEWKYVDSGSTAILNAPEAGSELKIQRAGNTYMHLTSGGAVKVWGGDNNTNGHTVPNVADDTFALLDATQTFTEKTLDNPTLTSWPAFSVQNSGAGSDQSISASTWTQVEFGTEDFDSDGDFVSDTFTPSAPGKYLLTATVYLKSLASGKLIQLALYKNGSEFKVGEYKYQDTSGDISVECTWIVDANGDTDNFEVWLYHNDTTTRAVSKSSAQTYFQGCRIK